MSNIWDSSRTTGELWRLLVRIGDMEAGKNKYLRAIGKIAKENFPRLYVSSHENGYSFGDALDLMIEALSRADMLDGILALDREGLRGLPVCRDGKLDPVLMEGMLSVIRNRREREAGAENVGAPGAPVTEKRSPARGQKPVTEEGRVARVLFADDEAMLREISVERITALFSEVFPGGRCRVDMAESGEEALAILDEKGMDYYDMVVLDNDFKAKGELSGLEAGRRMVEEGGFDLEAHSLVLWSGDQHPEAENWFSRMVGKPATLHEFSEGMVNPLVESFRKRLSSEEKGRLRSIPGTTEGINAAEASVRELFDGSAVGLAIFGRDGHLIEWNKAYYDLMRMEESPLGKTIGGVVAVKGKAGLDWTKVAGKAMSLEFAIGAGEVTYNILPIGLPGEAPFEYLVQVQSKEEEARQEAALEAFRLRASEIEGMSRREKAEAMRMSSAGKVALVYGEDFRKAVKMLAAVGFKGEIVVARTPEELRSALSSGEQFDILINTTAEDIKKLLANMDLHLAVVDDLTDTNTFQNTLLQVCA